MRDSMIRSVLIELNETSTEIEASALVSVDGLMMASVLPEQANEDHIAAMSAAILSIGDRAAKEFERGDLDQVLIKGKLGYVIISHTGPDAVIAVMAKSTAKLGLVFLDIKRAVEKVIKLL